MADFPVGSFSSGTSKWGILGWLKATSTEGSVLCFKSKFYSDCTVKDCVGECGTSRILVAENQVGIVRRVASR